MPYARAIFAFSLIGSLSALSCDNRTVVQGKTCPTGCTFCNMDQTCGDCDPAEPKFCNGNAVYQCNPDGTLVAAPRLCDDANNEHCENGVCLSECAMAASTRSYIGCDYWPVPLINSSLDPMFDFAVVVANPLEVKEVTTSGPARIKVVAGDVDCVADGDPTDAVAVATVRAGGVETIVLPWIDGVSQLQGVGGLSSISLGAGSYHLCSSRPVSVYQFNPLQFEKNPPAGDDCPTELSPGFPEPPPCHTYTNDASTLLPESTLGREYIVAARGTMEMARALSIFPTRYDTARATPGFFAVVGVQDETKVTITYSAHTLTGINLDERNPGDTDEFVIQRGETLQILSRGATFNPLAPKAAPCVAGESDQQAAYCDLGPEYDLTGTHIVSDKPIAVYGGHSCAFVPYNRWACDHLEEQILPLGTWGKRYLAVQTPPTVPDEPNLFRVLSGENGNQITIDGAVPETSFTLDRGQWKEFTALGAFEVTGTERLLVIQYMVGQSYSPNRPSMQGDPSMGLIVPVEQYRKNYDFLTPGTYTSNYLTVVGLQGKSYVLDDVERMLPLDPMSQIGVTNYAFEVIPLTSGQHHLSSDDPMGISVSGTARFTSYLLPGGLNLTELDPG